MVVVGRNGYRGYRGALPEVLVIDLRDSDVKFVTQPILQTLYHVPFVFQRVRFFQTQFQRQDTYCRHQANTSLATRSFTKASMTSPCLTSEKFSRVMPHSCPLRTSLT